MAVPEREHFEAAYTGKPPWEIGRPQPEFIDAADGIRGSVLDAGCGTGENALYFAERGRDVTGIDFLAEPIRQAQHKVRERGITATFVVRDALALGDPSRPYDSIIDCGLFHVFSDDDRPRYVSELTRVAKSGGRLFLLCFSDAEPGEQGPRRVSEAELCSAFAEGWVIESLKPTHFEIRPDLQDVQFSEGGPKAWFAVIRRT